MEEPWEHEMEEEGCKAMEVDTKIPVAIPTSEAKLSRVYVQARVGKHSTTALLDGGAKVTVMSEEFAGKMVRPEDIEALPVSVYSASNHKIDIAGVTRINIRVGRRTLQHRSHVAW